MSNRDQYDGQPYFCQSCGERHPSAGGLCGTTGECELETKQTADFRARRKRPKTSDVLSLSAKFREE